MFHCSMSCRWEWTLNVFRWCWGSEASRGPSSGSSLGHQCTSLGFIAPGYFSGVHRVHSAEAVILGSYEVFSPISHPPLWFSNVVWFSYFTYFNTFHIFFIMPVCFYVPWSLRHDINLPLFYFRRTVWLPSNLPPFFIQYITLSLSLFLPLWLPLPPPIHPIQYIPLPPG